MKHSTFESLSATSTEVMKNTQEKRPSKRERHYKKALRKIGYLGLMFLAGQFVTGCTNVLEEPNKDDPFENVFVDETKVESYTVDSLSQIYSLYFPHQGNSNEIDVSRFEKSFSEFVQEIDLKVRHYTETLDGDLLEIHKRAAQWAKRNYATYKKTILSVEYGANLLKRKITSDSYREKYISAGHTEEEYSRQLAFFDDIWTRIKIVVSIKEALGDAPTNSPDGSAAAFYSPSRNTIFLPAFGQHDPEEFINDPFLNLVSDVDVKKEKAILESLEKAINNPRFSLDGNLILKQTHFTFHESGHRIDDVGGGFTPKEKSAIAESLTAEANSYQSDPTERMVRKRLFELYAEEHINGVFDYEAYKRILLDFKDKYQNKDLFDTRWEDIKDFLINTKGAEIKTGSEELVPNKQHFNAIKKLLETVALNELIDKYPEAPNAYPQENDYDSYRYTS